MLPLPGSASPSASVRQFIELAVNIPEQEPQVGQAERSYSKLSSSETLRSAAMTMESTRFRRRSASFVRPASIGPPETNSVGMSRRSAAISMPGVILSQLEMHTSASGAMGVDHVFDRVGDEIARGQAVEHAVVPHGDAVIDGDGVEFAGHASSGLDLGGHQSPEVAQMHVPWDELGERVGDGDDRLVEIRLAHARGAP